MDQQFPEDFQFKPLTEGLGFHKKTLDLKDEATKSMPTQTGILPQSKKPLASAALGRANFLESVAKTSKLEADAQAHSQAARSHATRMEMTQKPQARTMFQTQTATSLNTTVQAAVRTQKAKSFSWPSAIFDTAIIAGLCLLFTAAVFALTKAEINTIVEGVQTDLGLQLATFLIVFAVTQVYTVACRAYFGKTLGEYVFDTRLGKPDEQKSAFYPFKVSFRTLLLIGTGFVLPPVLSSAFRKDLAGALSGVSLYSENE
jgi:uncharacterized RDD family membrane protein YckC